MPVNKNSTTNRNSANRGVAVGGVKTKSKKKFILFSFFALLLLAGLGYGGNYGWQKYQSKKQISTIKSQINANAASNWENMAKIKRVYGNLLVNDSNIAVWACNYRGREVSVLTVRKNIAISIARPQVAVVSAMVYLTPTAYDQAFKWWGNINLQRVPTVRNGRNFIGWNSARLSVSTNDFRGIPSNQKIYGHFSTAKLQSCGY